jgi:hypothetical protein
MAISARRQRIVMRWLHISVGSLLATYVYLPPGSASWLRWTLMLAGVPAVSLTGVWMWKQAALRRILHSALGRRTALRPMTPDVVSRNAATIR